MFTARYGLSPYITQKSFVFKGLILIQCCGTEQMGLYIHSPHTNLLNNGILCLYYKVITSDNILIHICYVGRGVRQGCFLSPILFNFYSKCLTNETLDGLGDFWRANCSHCEICR